MEECLHVSGPAVRLLKPDQQRKKGSSASADVTLDEESMLSLLGGRTDKRR